MILLLIPIFCLLAVIIIHIKLREYIELNESLASFKYFNSTIIGWWIPDEIDEVEPIR